jgi:hypothetical protein
MGKTLAGVLSFTPAQLSQKSAEIISQNADLRSKIISIGIPILMPDGKSLLRGPEMKIPPFKTANEFPVTPRNIEDWTYDGWVDLREINMKTWIQRLQQIKTSVDSLNIKDTSSHSHHNGQYWRLQDELHIGRLVSWIFIFEEKGGRIKD